jgi:nitroimidazol reductase NimA-like FMN-containing flavoprotein (pyridoxamine 5'-phosphate oxidase superfamily)
MSTTMSRDRVAEIVDKPHSRALLGRDIARLAYVAPDGTPRVVPMAFSWNGTELVMCTAPNAAKTVSLRHAAAVSLTIDTEVHPPHILLVRGEAVLEEVDGIPEEYLEANTTYSMTPEQRAEWEAGVRALYDTMVRIVVTPTWAKLIDFDETLPTAVEDLIPRQASQAASR